MSQTDNILKRSVPLRKVVMAAVVDTGEDVGRVEHSFSHWAARGLKKLETETLRSVKVKALLTVNKNTRTATLPPGFDYETFVGIIDRNGKKIPLKLRTDIPDAKNIEDIPCEDRCEKCNQDKSLCEDLKITEETSIVDVNGFSAVLTVIKKLYPDGKYYLETITPVWDVDAEAIAYHTAKEFITEIDLKPCGCIDETDENIDKIKTLCPEVWACHFCSCDTGCNVDYGSYQIFEESGMIYFDKPRFFDKVYIEGRGFMTKINGQYRVPKLFFETLVEWTVYKFKQHKKNIPRIDKDRQYDSFKIERANAEHVMGRISLQQIMKWIEAVPKFDTDADYLDYCGIETTTPLITSFSALSTNNSSSGSSGSSGSTNDDGSSCDSPNSVCCPCPAGATGMQSFQIAVIAGMGTGTPTPGVNYYQLDILKNALNLNIIFVNNTPENTKNQQFTFDAVTGTIYRWQGDGVTANDWLENDTLIANFNKLL